VRDAATHATFYPVRMKIAKTELAKLGGKKLVPGMPAEAFVATGNRTVLAYLLQPLAAQVSHAFREAD
jgi:HlyD family secretion protein